MLPERKAKDKEKVIREMKTRKNTSIILRTAVKLSIHQYIVRLQRVD